MITLTREEAQQVLDALEYNQANWQGKDKAIEALRARLSQCERCGEVNPAEIHTCTPQDTVLLSYWQEEARRYCENAEYWRSRCNAQTESDIVQDAVVYGTGIAKDGKRIDPASIYKEPEPVAWMNEGDIGKTDWKVWAYGKPTAPIPLYPAPPRSKHWSDCAVHSEPAYPAGECDCGLVPVAWADKHDIEREGHDFYVNRQQPAKDGVPLYRDPLQRKQMAYTVRKWQGLTDEDKHYLNEVLNLQGRFPIIDAIEAKLKEKNT
jgi:hypothetical protein